MADIFENFQIGLESPAVRLYGAAPSDSSDLPNASRAINVATAGSVRVTTIHGDTDTVYIAAGITFPLRVRRIWQSGTSATGIVVLY